VNMKRDMQTGSVAPAGDARAGTGGAQWTRLLLWAVLVVVSSLVLFYAVENYRGWRAWKAEEARLRQAGEPLTWKDLLSPAPQPEENLAAAPIYAQMFDALYGELAEPGVSNRLDAMYAVQRRVVIELAPRGYSSRLPDIRPWMQGRLVDLEAWAAHFRNPEQPDQVERPFPAAPEGSPAAAQVLAALSLYDEQFRQIEEAARRPRARFPVRYEDNADALLPHLSLLRSHVTALVLRGVSYLRLGRADEAYRDWQTARRLVAALEEEPILVSQMARVAVHLMTVQIPWEAMALRAWDVRKWQAVREEMERSDFIPPLHRALRGERVLVLGSIEQVRRNRGLVAGTPIFEGSDPSLLVELARWVPSGWYRQNMVRLSRFYSAVIASVPAADPLVPDWEALERLQRQVEPHGVAGPYNFVVRIWAPPVFNIVRRIVTAQAVARECCTAAVLEQYRVERGEFPADLRSVAGGASWARDPFDGKPLRYSRTGPQAFVLYSIGPDRQDDGGQGEVAKGSRWPEDLVWRVPPAASGERPAGAGGR